MQNKQPSAVDTAARQLELAQKEMAGLLYAISHDVRAPLRSIAGFSQALQEHCAASLDDAAQRYLQHILQANQKLSAYIEGLLSLSRITHAELRVLEIDLTELCNRTTNLMRSRYPQQSVAVALQSDMQVRGDPQLLKTALEHIFDNAWKATASTPDASFAVNCRVQNEHVVVTLCDNGIGFDMHYLDKLFVPFQHLHASEFSAGLGIGLATVQRIALKHGGYIHAESHPQHGTAFHLELPPA